MKTNDIKPGDILVAHKDLPKLEDIDSIIPKGTRGVVMCSSPMLIIEVFTDQYTDSRIVLTYDSDTDLFKTFEKSDLLDVSQTLKYWSVGITEMRSISVGVIKFDLIFKGNNVGYLTFTGPQQVFSFFDVHVNEAVAEACDDLNKIVNDLMPYADGLTHPDGNIEKGQHIILIIGSYLAQGLNAGAISIENYVKTISLRSQSQPTKAIRYS